MDELNEKVTDAESSPGLQIDVAEPDPPITTLAPAPRAALALKSPTTQAEIAKLIEKHAGLVEIKDKAGREQVHGAAMELMRCRTSIKARADEVRDDAKKFNAAVIAEEKRLTGLIEPAEQRLKALRDAWDAEQERIRQEKAEKEKQRLLAIGARIKGIKDIGRLAQDCRTSDAVRRLQEKLAAVDMTGFDEFESEAVQAYTDARALVEAVLTARIATEAEAARLKAEREELARQQAEAQRKAEELAAQQKAEADRLAAERAEIERMRAEIEAAKATIPAVVAPEKQDLANAVREIADVGISIADAMLRDQSADEDLASMVRVNITDGSMFADDDDTPPATSLINAIATAYGVDNETACHWLCVRADDFLEWTDPAPTTTA